MPSEPSGATARTSRRPGPSLEGTNVALLTTYVVLVVAIPSELIVGPLGGAGTPAQILGLLLLVRWIFMRSASAAGAMRRPRQPLRIAVALLGMSMLASYIAAASRPIATVEVTAADRGLVSTISWLGVFLVAAHSLVDKAQLDQLLQRLAFAGGGLALLGLVQFASGLPLTNYIQIPGLSANGDLVSIGDRGSLARPAGTAAHPIEFGAVLALILPIALHYALFGERHSRFARWLPVAAISFAIPISISRSAIVSVAVVLAVLLPTWSRALRRRAFAAIGVVVGCCYLLVPGLVGTLTGLFTGLSGDPSTKSRTDSYGLAWTFIRHSPVFGRGFRTFLPSYRIFDNQYLTTIVETGIVGLVALLAVFAAGVAGGLTVARRSADPSTRDLGRSLAAGLAGTGVSLALFDTLSFPMITCLLFLVFGCTSALWRIAVNPTSSDEVVLQGYQ